MSKYKYILVSQGIKIYETSDYQKAKDMADKDNREYEEYLVKLHKNYDYTSRESFVDNRVYLYKENLETGEVEELK